MSETKSKFANSDSFSSPKRKNNSLLTLIIGIIILVILVIVLTFIFLKPAMNQTSSWSAVFLTNGRTYFGKIETENTEFITLNNVYYLQVQEVPPVAEGEVAQQQLSLMSVGDEMHGPEDFMRINKDHVLFIEKLKANSSVVTSIEQQLSQ